MSICETKIEKFLTSVHPQKMYNYNGRTISQQSGTLPQWLNGLIPEL